MGGRSEAKAKAAQARETARQYEDLKRRAGKVKYNQEEVLENLKKASEVVPEIAGLYEAVQRDPSALEDIQTDPMFDEIMKGNLETVQEMAEEGGFTEEDKAKRRQLQRAATADAKSRDKSIVRQMMERGQAGSGTELLARLKSSQDTAQRQAEATDRLATDSASARRAALAQASQQASGMQARSFGQQAQKATAADQIAAFNAMQRQAAQDRNLQMKQQRENIAAQQKAGYYQGAAQTEQQRFSNEMSKLGLQSNLTGAAGQARMAGVEPRTNWGAIAGTALGAGLGGLTGTPQGVTAGAQIGGSLGGAIAADGGVKHGKKYYNGGISPQMMGADTLRESADKNMLSRENELEARDIETETETVLDKEMLANILGATAKNIEKPNRTTEKLDVPKFNSSIQNYQLPVQQMGGITAADGAVKLTPEQMRDSLLKEIDTFACGGVKHGKDYEDGGITPELMQATKMLRTGQPAPAAPMPGNQPPMPVPMSPQGQMMEDGGMAYEDGGEGTIIDSGMDMYQGDQLPDRINDGEMVLNVEQQDRLNDQLQELKRLKSKERTDKMLADGTAEVNPMQQEAMMAFVRGEINVDELPSDRVVKEPTVGEPSGRMAEFLGMLGKKKRG